MKHALLTLFLSLALLTHPALADDRGGNEEITIGNVGDDIGC